MTREGSGEVMKSRAWSVMMGLLLLATFRTADANGAEVLPVGTVVNVRTTQPIVVYQSHVGMRFRAIVEDPMMDVRGHVVVPRGSLATLEAVDVQQSSNLKGRDRITLRVVSIHVGDRRYPVTSSSVELKGHSEGKRAARKIGGGAGVGAVVGGLLGGGTGAAIGATAGGTTGAVVAGSGKTHLSVPAETRLQFRLEGPVRIQR
jgi:hypothetical protein